MKKLIVFLLVFVLILSIAGCGKKGNSTPDTQPQNGGSSQAGSVTPTGEAEDDETDNSGASAESTAPSEEPTEPTQDPNKIDPAPTTPNKDKTDKDEDIKVDFDDNGGTDSPVITPPDDNNNRNFVIDFDDLLEASKK